MELPVNGVSRGPSRPMGKAAESVRFGERPSIGWANAGFALWAGCLASAGPGAAWGIAHPLAWIWPVGLALLALAGWVLAALYADSLVRQGRYDEALRLVPLAAVSRAGRGRLRAEILTEAGRYEEALCARREALRAEQGALCAQREAAGYVPGTKAANLTRVRVCLDLEDVGSVVMEMGRFEEARQCFRSAARVLPSHSGWATGMAEVLLREGESPETALAHAEKSLGLFRSSAERFIDRGRLGPILATKAWALAACGRGAEAEAAIDAALKSPARRRKGTLAQVHYKAGMAFLALSDPQRAEQHFVRGTEVNPAGRWGRLCTEALRRQGWAS